MKMTKLIASFVLIIASSVAMAAPARVSQPAPRPTAIRVTLAQVVSRVSKENLSVQQNAMKVYQARKAISVARGNLLPKLNIWRILSTPFDPQSALGIIEDIAPFMIPGNWFQLKAQKIFYWAELEGYRTLWANEVMAAKSLYFHLSFDKTLLGNLQQSQSELKSLLTFVQNQEAIGVVPQGTSREIEVRVLALEEDTRAVKMLVEEENSLLAIMLGYGAMANLDVETVAAPNYGGYPLLRTDDYEKSVLTVSPELRQYHYLIYASQYVKKEAMFSLFGVSSLSRGVAGGIFDNVPIQDGLGFGTPASIAIAKSQTQMIGVQKEGAAETLRRQLRLVVSNYNLEVQNNPGAKRRVELTAAIYEQMQKRLSLGEIVPVSDLLDASRNRIQAMSALAEAQTRFMVNHDRLMRLTMQQDYSKAPSDGAITKK